MRSRTFVLIIENNCSLFNSGKDILQLCWGMDNQCAAAST